MSTQSTKQPMFIELPAEADSTDPGPFHAIQAGLATGIYPDKAWPEIAFFVLSKEAKAVNPRWRKCKLWNQAVYAVHNQILLDPSQFEGEEPLPRPPRRIMAAKHWYGMWRTQAIVILEPEDHVVAQVGGPVPNPAVQFVVRSSASLGSPLFATHRMNAAPLVLPSHEVKSEEVPVLLSTDRAGAKQQEGPSGRLHILPELNLSALPLRPPPLSLFPSSSQALPQPMHETHSLDAMSMVRSIPSPVAKVPAHPSHLAPAPSTLAGDSDEEWSLPVSESTRDGHVSSARMSMSSPSLGGRSPERSPVETSPPLEVVRQLEVIERSDERLRALSRMRTQDLSFEAEVNVRLIIQALDGWFFTREGADAIRRAVANLN